MDVVPVKSDWQVRERNVEDTLVKSDRQVREEEGRWTLCWSSPTSKVREEEGRCYAGQVRPKRNDGSFGMQGAGRANAEIGISVIGGRIGG